MTRTGAVERNPSRRLSVRARRLLADLAPCTWLEGVSGVAVSLGWTGCAWAGAALAGTASITSDRATTAAMEIARPPRAPLERRGLEADPRMPICAPSCRAI